MSIWRPWKFLTHLLLVCCIANAQGKVLMVYSVSRRKGNYSPVPHLNSFKSHEKVTAEVAVISSGKDCFV